jgi:hypothetical protein
MISFELSIGTVVKYDGVTVTGEGDDGFTLAPVPNSHFRSSDAGIEIKSVSKEAPQGVRSKDAMSLAMSLCPSGQELPRARVPKWLGHACEAVDATA